MTPAQDESRVALADAICAALPRLVLSTLGHWEDAAEGEPWLTLPPAHRLDSLPDVIASLLDHAVCARSDPAARPRHLRAAAEHGEHRRAHGGDLSVVFADYYLLRAALARALAEVRRGADVNDLLIRIDRLLTASTRAAVHGWHRCEFDAQGRWPAVLDVIVAEPD